MKKIRTPLSLGDIKNLKLGETVSLSGLLYTARDKAHIRMLDYLKRGEKVPFDLSGAAVYHCGPIMENRDGHWKVVAAGPTTSARMNFAWGVIEEGIRAVVGKGGMDARNKEEMKKHGCVYLASTGGAAVLAAKGMKEVKAQHWPDLGMAESVWVIEADDFGPLIVAMDAEGGSIYDNVDKAVETNLPVIKAKLGI